jgi:arabinose-5-phosphate isomerase
MGAKLIAITGKPESSLARSSGVRLDVAIQKEACPRKPGPNY